MDDAVDADDEMEAELRNVILRAFAAGADVEGVLSVETVPDEIPDWKITITERGAVEGTTVGVRSEGSPVGATAEPDRTTD